MLQVTENNPRALDDQFAEEYPALGLKTTSNSGAFWGDGDLRASAVDYSRMLFAVESKARFRGPQCRKLTPMPFEWDKAMGTATTSGQLRRFTPDVTRLFLVYSKPLRTFAVCIPFKDAEQLAGYSEEMRCCVEAGVRGSRRRGEIAYWFYDEPAWDALYAIIKTAQQEPV